MQLREYLNKLGLTAQAVEHAYTYICNNKCIFEQWGIDMGAIELIRSIHSNSYYMYGTLESVILAPKGGRQGCTFGAIIFNAVYAIALIECHTKLQQLGVSFTARQTVEVPWRETPANVPQHKVVCDATYVDDEALVIIAKTAQQLDKSIDLMLSILVDTFSKFSLKINWAPGKTEMMLKYRGKHATAALERRRIDGAIAVALPANADAKHVVVVDRYKHLGSITSVNNCDMHEAQHRCSEALSAYAPLACKIFGSPKIGAWLKYHFMDSLVMTKLMYCIHTLTLKPAAICKLNAVHMRVLRRIAGEVRFSATTACTDPQVRSICGKPSIDCLLVRARLHYIRRVCKHSNQALYIILCMRHGKEPLPWVRQLVSDFGILARHAHAASLVMPNPEGGLSGWLAVFDDKGAWDRLVSSIYYTSSCSDIVHDSTSSASTRDVHAHICMKCPEDVNGNRPSWSTSRALESHMRAKHKVLCEFRYYVDSSGRCPICHTDYKSRIRCLAHICDRRRPKCANEVKNGNARRLPENTVLKLDEADREQRRLAQRQGRSHPIARTPATTCTGRVVGRVTA